MKLYFTTYYGMCFPIGGSQERKGHALSLRFIFQWAKVLQIMFFIILSFQLKKFLKFLLIFIRFINILT